MALALFDKPLYSKRRYFIQEITGLDGVFDFLDEWPQEKAEPRVPNSKPLLS